MADLEKQIESTLKQVKRTRVYRGRWHSSRRKPMFIGDYTEHLSRQHPAGRTLYPPIEAWYVAETGHRGKPERVKIKLLRGSCDSYSCRYDYAELEDGRKISTTYVFPVKGYTKPKYALITDNFGPAHNWVALPNGAPAEMLAEYRIELGK